MNFIKDLITTAPFLQSIWKNNKRPPTASPIPNKKRPRSCNHEIDGPLFGSDTNSFVAQSVKSERFTNMVFERSCSDGPIDLVNSNETGNEQQGPDNEVSGFTFKDGSIDQQHDVVDETSINLSTGYHSSSSPHVSTVKNQSLLSSQDDAIIGLLESSNESDTKSIVSSATKHVICNITNSVITNDVYSLPNMESSSMLDNAIIPHDNEYSFQIVVSNEVYG